MKESEPRLSTFSVEFDDEDYVFLVCLVCEELRGDAYVPDTNDSPLFPTLKELHTMARNHIRTPEHRGLNREEHKRIIAEHEGFSVSSSEH